MAPIEADIVYSPEERFEKHSKRGELNVKFLTCALFSLPYIFIPPGHVQVSRRGKELTEVSVSQLR